MQVFSDFSNREEGAGCWSSTCSLLAKSIKTHAFDLAVIRPTRGARPVDFEGNGFCRLERTDRTGMLASSGVCQRTCSHTLQREPTQRCDQRNDREETAYLVHDTPLCLLFKQKLLVFHLPLPLQGVCSQSNGPI